MTTRTKCNASAGIARSLVLALALAAAALAGPATTHARAEGATPAADLDRAALRTRAEELGKAVVTVRVVANMRYSMGGSDTRESERKNEARGTVVGADGTTVVALSEVDPTELYKQMSRNSGEDMKLESNLKEVTLILPDNKGEVQMTVVQRDTVFDLAVLRPLEKQKEPFAFIDLAKGGDAKILDPIVIINRMGALGNRQLRLIAGEIEAITAKGQRFYIPSQVAMNYGTGVPAIGPDGKVLGLVVLKARAGSADTADSDREERVLGIILPTSDIQEVVKDAASKTPEPTATPAPAKSDDKKEEGADEKKDKPADEKEGAKADDTKKEKPAAKE